MKPGQIITADAATVAFLKHYGVIVKKKGVLQVLHNSPSRDSRMTPLEIFKRRRSNIRVIGNDLVGLTNKEITNRFNGRCKKKYSLLSYNCEHFVECMTGEERESTQLGKVTTLLGLILLIRLLKK